jgi:hypothetical protein
LRAQGTSRGFVIAPTQPAPKALAADGPAFPVTIDQEIGAHKLRSTAPAAPPFDWKSYRAVSAYPGMPAGNPRAEGPKIGLPLSGPDFISRSSAARLLRQ